MHPPLRFQDDIVNQEYYSNLAGIDFTDTDIIVRPEFEEETKIKNILASHGIDLMQRDAQNIWGKEVDDRIDLQTAIAASNEAKMAYSQVPAELRGEFPDWQMFLKGVENGSYQHALNELDRRNEEKKKRRQQRLEEQQELAAYRAKTAPQTAPSSDTNS